MSTLRHLSRVLLAHPPRPTTVLINASHIRLSSSSSSPAASSPFQIYPSPPRLSPAEQAEFERLQRKAGTLFSDPPSATSSASPTQVGAAAAAAAAAAELKEAPTTQLEPSSEGSEEIMSTTTSSGGVFRGAPPEFEGDVNPKTGEVGGPKNEPLRWGGRSDWSYNGRVTDF